MVFVLTFEMVNKRELDFITAAHTGITGITEITEIRGPPCCWRPSSWRRRKRRQRKSCKLKPVKADQVSRCAGVGHSFSPLYTAQIQEQNAYSGSQGQIYLFDPCRLGLFLAYCAKGSNRSNFPWIRLPKWPRWEIASYLYGACKQVSASL